MAPGRRRGAKGGGQREWRVGDLVLAKVKGFPAWPAKVDAPGTWGLPVDSKKVFVYFFGTQQIAFCNPADVEPYTEEKREHLIVKRHTRGSDFVRAVCEIINNSEKLKNEDKGTNIPLMGEVNMTNDSNSIDSWSDSSVKGEASKAISMGSIKVRYDDDFLVGGASAADKQDPFRIKEATPSEDPLCDVNAKEISLPAVEDNGVAQAQKLITEKQLMSARRSRNASQVNSYKLRNSILPSSKIIESAGVVGRSGMRNPSCRSRRIKKSPDVSKLKDVISPASFSCSSYAKNDSEIGTFGSGSLSLNEESTMESGYGLPQTESVVECTEGDAELIKKLDVPPTAVIVKKRRKPIRKRAKSGTNELFGLEKEPALEIEDHKAGQTLPSNKDSDVDYINDDGDEHLPLLKRARVRMGLLSSDEEPDSPVHPEKSSDISSVHPEKSSEVPYCPMMPVKDPLNSEEDNPFDRNRSVGMEELDNSSLTNKFPVNKPTHQGVSPILGRPVDVEAALPPSKRIQRALEAMSANVADDVQGTSEGLSTMRTFVKTSCSSALSDNYNMSPGNKSEHDIMLRKVDYRGRISSQDDIVECSANSFSLEAEKHPASHAEVAACNISLSSNHIPEHTSCGTALAVDSADFSDCKDPGVSSLSKNLPEPNVISQKPISAAVLDGGLISDKGKQEDLLQQPVLEVGMLFEENDLAEVSAKKSDPVPASVGTIRSSTHDDSDPLPCNLQSNCVTTNLSKLDTDKDENNDGMFVLKKETMVKDFEVVQSSTMEASPTTLQDVPHLLRSSSYSEDHLSCKGVSDIRSSPPSNGGSASENTVFCSNNGCLSLDAPSPHEKSIHAGKDNAQASAALESLKFVLRFLTRTISGIGSATRIAIKCGKLGIASEVVEVLACNLEREPSLPKRVDLFFLVDSILQCSQGMKGEIGGLYTSAIQAQLPRLLLAAAPPGSNGQENRRECLKVLRLWQERRVLSESVIHSHIRDLDSASNPASGNPNCPRLERNERALDDPLREVEGIVDEYGSNSSIQRPKDEDEGNDSDMGIFEAVTPEHNSEKTEGQIPIALSGKRSCILDAVDGEVEMEDVAPCEAEMRSTGNVQVHISEHRFEQNSPVTFFPPLPKNVTPSSPRVAPPPLLPPPFLALTNSVVTTNDGKQLVTAPSSVARRVDPVSVDGCYHAPDNGDLQMSVQIPETANTGSFGSVPVLHSPIRPLDSSPRVDNAISRKKASHLRPHVFESVNRRPSGSVTVSRPPIQPVNSAPQVNGSLSQKKASNLRPPLPASSNQFSYVRADQRKVDRRTPARDIPPSPSHFNRTPARDIPPSPSYFNRTPARDIPPSPSYFNRTPARDIPPSPSYFNRTPARDIPPSPSYFNRTPARDIPPSPSYSNRSHPLWNRDRANFYGVHDRYGAGLHNAGINWRHTQPYCAGVNNYDRRRIPYAYGIYGGSPREPPREPLLPSRSWVFPPSPINHREFMLHGQPLGGTTPVASRGPSYWRPSPR